MAAQQSRQIVDAYAASQANIIEQMIRLLLGMWLPFIGWRSPDMVHAQAAGSAARVDAGLAEARRLARAYARAMLADLDVPTRGLPSIVNTYERGGIGIVEVYERPAKQFIHELSQGGSLEVATDAATQRIRDLVTADVRAVARDEVNKVFAAVPEVIGYRRVIHPERSKSGTCGLCVVAATQFYKKEELLPLHDECKCEPMAITKDFDPGFTLNREDLDAIYAAAGSSLAEDLKNTRVEVREHGELGPILVRSGQHFRDVAEVNRNRKPATPKFTPYERMSLVDQLKMWDATKASSERAIAKLAAARAAGTASVDMAGTGRPVEIPDIEQAIRYHTELIARANSYLL